MNDRDIMENLLLTTKGVLDLYMHGAIESGTENVHNAFNTAFNQTLAMGDWIYKQMESRGWYTAEQAEAQKIQQVRQKFAAQG